MNKFNDSNFCPVPRDQRPFYEYLKRKRSSLFGWVRLNESGYTSKFFFTFFSIFLLNTFVINWFISLSNYKFYCLLLILFFSFLLQGLLYFNFLIAWRYIGRRLFEDKIIYEESGWYDGKIWSKPIGILRHERLLYDYQLVPLINRIEKTLQLILLGITVVIAFIFLFMY
uniref:hypothetical protein Ycf36 n=1 Tax=Lietzensia polymorpha TaxID=2962110 RepID=UPI0021820194|nr:hypothetical protein Ycf36 [Lietzensia polymorpha]UVI61297.1 hypothetical protein Ycf36 [Lietzensia polymorpha]